jgi:hypothetical protein
MLLGRLVHKGYNLQYLAAHNRATGGLHAMFKFREVLCSTLYTSGFLSSSRYFTPPRPRTGEETEPTTYTYRILTPLTYPLRFLFPCNFHAPPGLPIPPVSFRNLAVKILTAPSLLVWRTVFLRCLCRG